MLELSLKVEVEESADLGPLQQDILKDLHIRTAIERVPLGSLPRFELKSRRIRVLDS